jgi:hypothetical protein
MSRVDFVIHREDDGTEWIDGAPKVIHVSGELLGQLPFVEGLWWVGTEGRGAGRAAYKLGHPLDDDQWSMLREELKP